MLAKDILNNRQRDPITTKVSASVAVAMDLLITNAIGCLLVTGETEELIGIISDKDIFRHMHKHPNDFKTATVGDLMSTNLIVGVPDDEVGYLAGIMTNNRIRHIPIVEGRRLAGLISIGDVVKIQLENIQIENRYLREYIQDAYPG
jgi:CBS domain-containing protein